MTKKQKETTKNSPNIVYRWRPSAFAHRCPLNVLQKWSLFLYRVQLIHFSTNGTKYDAAKTNRRTLCVQTSMGYGVRRNGRGLNDKIYSFCCVSEYTEFDYVAWEGVAHSVSLVECFAINSHIYLYALQCSACTVVCACKHECGCNSLWGWYIAV